VKGCIGDAAAPLSGFFARPSLEAVIRSSALMDAAKLQNRQVDPMEVTIKHLDRVEFAIRSRSHTILCDQPAENGGEDSGMTPPELLLATLGSCAAFYAVQYLKTRSLAESCVEVAVTAEKLKQPPRLGNFRVHVACTVPHTAEHREGLMRSVHHCLVHNTLLTPPEIAIELATPPIAG
jgi:uncharacterized OsmC-like protein